MSFLHELRLDYYKIIARVILYKGKLPKAGEVIYVKMFDENI